MLAEQRATIAFSSILLSLSLLGLSCEVTTLSNTTNQGSRLTTKLGVEYADWTPVMTGVDFKQVEVTGAGFGSELFDIVRIDPQQQTISATWQSATPQTVADWQDTLAASVVINGTYFDEHNEPTTAVIVNNSSVGLWLGGNTGVLQSADQRNWNIAATTTKTANTWLLQSYPVLFANQHPILSSASTAVARRTVVAVDQTGLVYWLVTEYGNLTLEQLAKVVHSQLGLTLTAALNLDGGSSTGLVIKSPQLNYQTNSFAVPGILYLPGA